MLATKITWCLLERGRVRNCAFLVASATKTFALATRILQPVASGRFISGRDNYTNNNFDFQPKSIQMKFKATRQLVNFFCF